MLAEIHEKLNLFLKGKGLRSTPQRNSIIDIIFESDDHFTADELWERIRKTNSKASRATVYRTLGLLVEANLLYEIDLGEDTKTYDPNFNDKPAHNHLICIDCGKVLEFEDAHLELLNDCLTRRMGFRPKSQSIRIEANCEALRTKGSCQNLIQARIAGKRLPKKR
jgi:Fur family transcriptional regulator, ferric uptake regulator